jgi:plasmid stability protein
MSKMVSITVVLPAERVAAIKLRAQIEGRSMSNQCRELIELGLATQNGELKKLARLLEISQSGDESAPSQSPRP